MSFPRIWRRSPVQTIPMRAGKQGPSRLAPFFVTLRRTCAHANPEPSSANRTGYYVEFTKTRALEIGDLALFTAHIHCLRIINQMYSCRFDLCEPHAARRLPGVCPRGGAAHSSPSGDRLRSRVRRPPLQQPLAPLFDRAVDSFCVALSPESIRQHHGTVRNFLSYLGAAHPEVQRLAQLRREPHILGWLSRLHSQVPPLGTASYIIRLITLRSLLNELAWTAQLPELAHLIR